MNIIEAVKRMRTGAILKRRACFYRLNECGCLEWSYDKENWLPEQRMWASLIEDDEWKEIGDYSSPKTETGSAFDLAQFNQILETKSPLTFE